MSAASVAVYRNGGTASSAGVGGVATRVAAVIAASVTGWVVIAGVISLVRNALGRSPSTKKSLPDLRRDRRADQQGRLRGRVRRVPGSARPVKKLDRCHGSGVYRAVRC